MDIFALHLLNGLSYGMILFLIASGLTLILGVMGVFNLAHGAIYLVGAYCGLALAGLGGNFLVSALAAGMGAVVVGIVLERVFLSRLYKQINEQCLLTLGIVYVIGNVVLWIFGGFFKMGVPPAIASGSIGIGNYFFPEYRIMLILVGLVVALGLWFLQEKTRVGAIVRAGMDDKAMTMVLGINYSIFASVIFLIGAFFGGFAGFLGTPVLGISPGMGFPILLLAIVVVVIGGVGSLQGTLLGAILIGAIDSFGKVYYPAFAMFTTYLVMIVVLLVKPSGILGRKV